MKTPTFLLASFLALASAGSAHAACEVFRRIPLDEVNCLEASYKNSSGPTFWGHSLKKSKATARNKCSERGTMVVKINREYDTDWTWHLSNDKQKTRKGNAQIRGIYCCPDLSDDDLCTR